MGLLIRGEVIELAVLLPGWWCMLPGWTTGSDMLTKLVSAEPGMGVGKSLADVVALPATLSKLEVVAIAGAAVGLPVGKDSVLVQSIKANKKFPSMGRF